MAKVKKAAPGMPDDQNQPAPTPAPPAKAPPAQLPLAKGEDDEDDEGDDDGEEVSKSTGLTEDDLQKSIDALEATVAASSPEDRKSALMKKGLEKSLSAEENTELANLLSGKVEETKKSLVDEVTKGFSDNDDLQKSIDVSPYLDGQHQELVKSLSTVAQAIDGDRKAQHDFNIVLAKSMIQVLKAVKGVGGQVERVAAAPARGPKSVGAGRPAQGRTLEKGFAGGQPQGDQLSKGEVLDGLEGMMEKSMHERRDGKSPLGHDIQLAAARYETSGQIDRQLLGEVTRFVRGH